MKLRKSDDSLNSVNDKIAIAASNIKFHGHHKHPNNLKSFAKMITVFVGNMLRESNGKIIN